MTTAGAPAKAALFGDYQRLGGTYDEFFTETGDPRPEVAQLVRALDRLASKRETLPRRRHDNGPL